jgi:hypothetical protein
MNVAETKLKEAISAPDIGNKIYQSINGITKCLVAILDSKGEKGWSATIKDDNGNLMFSPEEQEQFENAFTPFIGMILSIFDSDSTEDVVKQVGGGTQQITQIGGSNVSLDGLWDGVLEANNRITKALYKVAGILHLEKEYDDQKDDPHPLVPVGTAFTSIATPFMGPVTAKQIGDTISEIPVPLRSIVFVVYTILDVARLMVAVAPDDSPYVRKVLSIVMSVTDILKADWKSAVINFAGYFDKSYVVIGTFIRFVLNTFLMISPDLGKSMFMGSLDVFKSLLAGTLLFVYKTFSPASARERLLTAFNEIGDIVKDDNKTIRELVSEGKMPYYLSPDMEHVQYLQAVAAHKELVCSKQFLNIIDKKLEVDKSSVLRIALELMRIPLTPERRASRCGSDLGKTYTEQMMTRVLNETEEPENMEKQDPQPAAAAAAEETYAKEEQAPSVAAQTAEATEDVATLSVAPQTAETTEATLPEMPQVPTSPVIVSQKNTRTNTTRTPVAVGGAKTKKRTLRITRKCKVKN